MDLGGPFDRFALSLRVCQGRKIEEAEYVRLLFPDVAFQPTFATGIPEPTRSRLQAGVAFTVSILP